MIIHEDVIQGTLEWKKLRLGMVTGSGLDKVLTAKTLKLSSQSDAYENQLVAERLTGQPTDDFGGNYHTERGKELEQDAASFYEMTTGFEVRSVSFISNDEKTFGCSPDMLVYDKGKLVGGLELKCPMQGTHVGYVLRATGAYDDYKQQVQGSLLVSGLEWWDIMSYHPMLKPSLYRVTRDEAYLQALGEALDIVEKNIQSKIAQIKGA